MAEKSLFWYTNGFTGDTGDGAAPYTQEEFRFFNASWATADPATQGPLKGVLNELAVSGSSSPLSVATGMAFVYGFPYKNDAAASVIVTTPSVGDTGGRIVLRANWSAQTVRIVLKTSSDGVNTIPALTQTAGTTWEISLASFVIDTSGNIWTDATKSTAGVADDRDFATTALIGNGAIVTNDLAPGAVTNSKLSNDSVDDAKIGNRVPVLANRQGGSATNWDTTSGTPSNYTVTNVSMQVGAARMFTVIGNSSVSTNITFPAAFANNPLILVTVLSSAVTAGGISLYFVDTASITTTGFTIQAWLSGNATASEGIECSWMAIGEPL